MISFQLLVPNTDECDIPDGRDKGVEVSIGNWNREGFWIPLAFYYASIRKNNQDIIHIGDFSDNNELVKIRGYIVGAKLIASSTSETLEICDPSFVSHGVQLRWLMTSIHPKSNDPPADVWALDNVDMVYVEGNTSQVLIHDTFESQEIK